MVAKTLGMILLVVSSTGHSLTGEALKHSADEVATPYYVLTDAGFNVQIASVDGGKPPVAETLQTIAKAKVSKDAQRFMEDKQAMNKLTHTHALSKVDVTKYKGLFLSGDHGAMYDFTSKPVAIQVAKAWQKGEVIATLDHGAAALINIKFGDDAMVKGHVITAFTNAEEAAAKSPAVQDLPFKLEDRLKAEDAVFMGGPDFIPHALRDEHLISGQNPQSAKGTAEEMLVALGAHTDLKPVESTKAHAEPVRPAAILK